MISRVKILWIVFSLLIFLLNAHVCTAQFTDTFSDGDFTANPVWIPDNASHWVIDGNQLRSNSAIPSSGFSIVTSSATATNAQWEFLVNLQFNTSGANYVDVFLMSELADLTSTGNNGYFVRIGGTPDEISLYKLAGGTSTMLINGTDGITNVPSSTLRIKITRDASHLWQLERDLTGTGDHYVTEGMASSNAFTVSNFFGIRVQQSTASFFNKHFFDDFYVGSRITDTNPPAIVSVTATSSSSLTVVFNEKVESVSAETTSNYQVNHDVGNPATALLQPDQQTVHLTFLSSFPNAITSELTVTAVKDYADNTVSILHQDFFWFLPVAAIFKDIIITELFADPSPVVGLPEAEYIELYNRSTEVFDLQNWKITDGSSAGTLPPHLIRPHEFVILTTSASAALFKSFGTVLAVQNFPTLNNIGDALVLKDPANVNIDAVSFSDTWYRDDDKRQGGYALELIDPANPCGEEDNWIASEAPSGGTPGTSNSVLANKPDLTGPQLISAIPVSATVLIIHFNEKLQAQLPSLADFTIEPGLTISEVSFSDASLKSFQITLSDPIQQATTYTITVNNVSDCNGNPVQPDFDTAVFGLPAEADSLDVVVNEILFNPRPTGVDFVEVYNRSDKFINLKNWSIANFEGGVLVNLKRISANDFLLRPHQYLVLTENGNVLAGEYVAALQENFLETNLPGFNDDAGTVAIANASNEIVDFFSYTDNFHSVFIRDDEGVSLERISFTASTNLASNWKSASATCGFATPGYRNSNIQTEQPAGKITVEPEAFEPITGQPSFTQIYYSFQHGGFVANVKILDFQGREIKQLVNNATLGTDGFFRWDGDTNDGAKARVGYYVVWIEVFNARGQVNTYRKRVVIASRN